MRFSWNGLALSFLLLFALTTGSRTAAAQIDDNGKNLDGIYDDGSFLLHVDSCSETDDNPCYRRYGSGSPIGTLTPPNIPFDNGTACTVEVEGYSAAGHCNGDYEIFAFTHFDPLAKLLQPGLYGLDEDGIPVFLLNDPYAVTSPLDLNDHGAFAFDDVNDEYIYSGGTPATTPEPGTWVLLLTGAALGLTLHRRILA